MVTRNRLVQEQRLGGPPRPRREAVSVGLEVTRSASVDRAGQIVRRSGMTAAGGPPLLPAVGWSVLQAKARKVRPAGRRVLRHDRVRLIHPAVIRLSREIQDRKSVV